MTKSARKKTAPQVEESLLSDLAIYLSNRPALVLGFAAAVGGLVYFLSKGKTKPQPGSSRAHNSVIGGHPEDMNGMPIDSDLESESTVFDGSDLRPSVN